MGLSMLKVFHDAELEAALTWLVNRWSAATPAVLRLFRNDFQPTPATLASSFMEANFAGYNPVLLTGELTPPAKVQDGFWESLSDLYEFTPPAAPPGNVIFGAYLTLAGVAVASGRFDQSITMNPGFPAFRIRLRVSSKSESLFQLE